MKYENATLRQMLAAEYALGTLRGRARRRFERLVGRDAGLRAELTTWETRLAGLHAGLEPVAPPASVWLGVQHRLQTSTPKVAPLRVAERKPQPGETPVQPASMWRIVAGLAAAAAVVLAVMVGQRIPLPGAPGQAPELAQTQPATPVVPAAAAGPTFVALLKLPESTMQWTLSLAPSRGRVNIAASGEYAQLGAHSLELWVITPDGPVSLGLLPVSGSDVLTLPASLAQSETLTLAVSLEPVGGSPTGKPTGPVLTSGAAIKAA